MWKNIFARLEATSFTLEGFLSAFLGIVGVRLFLEALSSPTSTNTLATDVPTMVHYVLFYFAVVLAIAFLLYRTMGITPRVAVTISLFGLVGVWIAPLIDLFFTLGKGLSMAYLFAAPAPLVGSLLSFFGPFILPGVTVGMRIEIFLLTLLLFLYAKYHGRSFFQAVFIALAGYATIFAFVALPSVLSLAHDLLHFSLSSKNSTVLVWFQETVRSSFLMRGFLHPSIRLSQDRLFETLFNVAMSQVLFWISLGFVGLGFLRLEAKKMRVLMQNMRPARVTHYALLIFAGFFLALQGHPGTVAWNWLDVSTLALTLFGFWSAWMFAVCVNDLVDEATDQISNPHRPLITGTLSPDFMRKAAAGFLGVTVLAGFLSGTYTLFFLGAFSAAYWVYSVPPLRLKRVPFLSNFLVGIACLSAFLSGFYLISLNRTVHALPFAVIAFVLGGFTLAANIKDLKDIAGDRAEGILTLPVWLGERRARRLIGGMIAFVFLLAPLVFGSILWIPALGAAGGSFVVCLQAKSPERGIFALYFLFAAVAFLLL